MSRRVRIKELATDKGQPPGLIPACTSTIWRWVQQGKFPKPIRLGGRTTVWDLAEVEKFLANCAEVQK